MNKEADQKISDIAKSFARAGTALELFAAFLVIIPLTLWLAWTYRSSLFESFALTLFCIAFAWLNLSILRWQGTLRKLGWSSPDRVSFGLGPRPDDPDELEIWLKGKHLRYSFTAVVLCMAAFGIVKWINGG